MSANLTYSESEVQALKAQEAKDYCLELMRLITARQEGPISPGEVQLEELRYELEVKEAEAEDHRQREAHLQRMKELELEIEHEKAEFAKAQILADERRERYAQVISQVAQSQEKLSVQLDRATREHNVKLQIMHNEYAARSEALQAELETLTARRDALIAEIGKLADLNSAAEDVDRLRSEIEEKRMTAEREHKQLDEAIEAATFEKHKALKHVRREQELALAELDAVHRKHLLDAKAEALDGMLKSLGFAKITPAELSQLRGQAAEQRSLTEQQVQSIREEAVAEFKRQFNLNATEPLDVTELFYRERALQEDNKAYELQVQKLEAEVSRMRTHIESESTRVAKAIEAARTNIQNNIEPGVKR
jgi:DNA repair exonuclease SbcCD ATPase subunit